ncbi:MAG: glycerol kinase GlpK [Hydrogenophilaceae bacterium]|jgi:glycerol kinase|nr:glycerol kinase GlpK [Hydrogenophilaceae bacterium]
MRNGILAIDQGTTSTRAIVFNEAFEPQAVSQIELTQHYPQPGWVEHDLEEIWRATLQTCREAIDKAGGPSAIAAIGITNQRETTAIWDRATGAPIHRAIVWQDRRTADRCDALRAAGHEAAVQERTGLVLDPYFSATKIAWILDHVPGARQRAEEGALAFGTIDSFLIWRLTNGRVHATDVTNAARTLLYTLAPPDWSDAMCALFAVPRAILPEARPSAGDFGASDPSHFGRAIPIAGVAGDQQAALVGHGCLSPGRAKATYGTGCFLVMNAGQTAPHSKNRLLATIGYQTKDQFSYALEGSIFSAGATIQWLRDGLKIIQASRESEALAASLKDNGGVYLVPAFAGLGAPQWNADARGAIVGLTRDSTGAHVVRAGIEAIAYQTRDLLDALSADGAPAPETLLVDGGVTANGWAMQFLADICEAPVERPAYQEVTALGAARLAALGAGLIPDLAAVPEGAPRARWAPQMSAEERARLLGGWRRAVAGALAVARPAATA